ncbi:MAG: hypothetical protein Ct9H300mP15_18860 [Gemmatimonadota bacterium]|nr:MAG: hypothetical protein Ct9H300mP15_18860 [Gemmatimonadota bacterium]
MERAYASFYYDPSRYDTYPEQLGIEYPLSALGQSRKMA